MWYVKATCFILFFNASTPTVGAHADLSHGFSSEKACLAQAERDRAGVTQKFVDIYKATDAPVTVDHVDIVCEGEA
jgi:hypothetical protein